MEIEGEWMKLLGELHDIDIPVIAVGLLPPSTQEIGDNNKDSTWGTIGEWLDKQEKGSVAYRALGSEIQPSQKDFKELALGLEQSGLPVFWALRKRIDLPNVCFVAEKVCGFIQGFGCSSPSFLGNQTEGSSCVCFFNFIFYYFYFLGNVTYLRVRCCDKCGIPRSTMK
jgi:hypothetical protein